MKKNLFLLLGMMALIFGGCAQKDKMGQIDIESTEASKELTTTSETSVELVENDTDNWDSINETLKSITESKNLKVVYETDNEIKNEDKNVSVTLNGYENIEIQNFSTDFIIPFGDQTDTGNVILLSMTIKNDTKESVYVGPGYYMSVIGYSSSISRNKSLLGDDIVSELVVTNNELKPNEEITGYVALSVNPEAVAKINENKSAKLELPGIFTKADSFSKDDALIDTKEIEIPLVGEGEDKLSEAAEFYQDKVTVDNWGTKTLITKKDINEEKSFSDIKVKFNGYQMTELKPNEDQMPRFEKFDKGIILMTASITIKNESKEAIKFDSTSATLTIGNSVKMMHENFLEVKGENEDLEPNKEDTKYIVFVIDKESYDKLYKDQEYNLDISLYDQKYARITEIDDISFKFKN